MKFNDLLDLIPDFDKPTTCEICLKKFDDWLSYDHHLFWNHFKFWMIRKKEMQRILSQRFIENYMKDIRYHSTGSVLITEDFIFVPSKMSREQIDFVKKYQEKTEQTLS